MVLQVSLANVTGNEKDRSDSCCPTEWDNKQSDTDGMTSHTIRHSVGVTLNTVVE